MTGNDTDWDRFKAILEELPTLDPAQRGDALRAAFPDDSDLRARIERLLGRYDSALAFFAQHADASNTAGPSRAFAVGDIVAGRFRIVRFLGQGGMGEVYAAVDQVLRDEPVALKTVLANRLASPADLQRLTEELRLARRITHPNVCRVHDVYRHTTSDGGELLCFAMELLKGEPLSARLAAGKLSPAVALPLLEQIAAAIDAAHAAGVVHGDLKPGNVLLVPSTSGDRAVVTDFGLARALPTDTGLLPPTFASVPAGTPLYMAPEQLLGAPASAASDIYAFGILCFEMAIGRAPFQTDSPVRLALRKLRLMPGFVQREAPDLDPRWESAIIRCLDVKPEQRFARASEVVGALTATPRRAMRWVALAAACALAVAGAATLVTRPSAPVPLGPEQTLAVLPFTPASAAPDTDAYALGLTAAVRDRLSTWLVAQKGPYVVPVSETVGTGVSTAALARESLGATTMVTARFVERDGRLRLAVRVDGLNPQDAAAADVRQVELAVDEGPLVDRTAAAVMQLLHRQAPATAEPAVGVAIERTYLLGRGYVLQGASQVPAAIEALGQTIREDDRFGPAHIEVAEAYLEEYVLRRDPGSLTHAHASIDRALSIAPENPRTHVVAGRIYLASGQPKRAVLAFKAALDRDPDVPDGRNRLAAAYEADGDLVTAESEYRAAVARHPKHWSGYEDLGNFLFARGRFAEAEQAYVQGSAFAPMNSRAILNLAAVYEIQERFAAAEAELRKGLETVPDALLYNNLAWVFILQADFEPAVRALREAVKLPWADSRIWSSYARACRWSGSSGEEQRVAYETALTLVRQELGLNPANADTRSNYAYLLAETQQRNEARTELQKALAEDSGRGNTSVLFRSALVREQLGDRAGALEALAQAARAGFPRSRIERDPDLRALRQDPAYERIEFTSRAK